MSGSDRPSVPWIFRLSPEGEPERDTLILSGSAESLLAAADFGDGILAAGCGKNPEREDKSDGDMAAVRIASDGRIDWVLLLGGTGTECARSAAPLSDGSVAVAGSTSSRDDAFGMRGGDGQSAGQDFDLFAVKIIPQKNGGPAGPARENRPRAE
jgi:hypothetical protein